MKKQYLLFCLACWGISQASQAQNWQEYDLSADGVGAKISFPAQPQKAVVPNGNTTNYNYKVTVGTETYILVASVSTGVFEEGTPQKRFEASTKTAKKVQNQGTTKHQTFDAYKGQAELANGNFADARYILAGNTFFQVLVTQPSKYSANSEKFFNSLKISPPVATAGKTTFAKDDRIEVKYNDPIRGEKWLPAIVLRVEANGNYFVNYDDYAESYNEAVSPDKVRPMNMNIEGRVTYIKAKKGETVTVKGNLSQGNILEDLEWAENSSTACWVGIRNVEFEGNHVFYWFDLPKKSIVNITVVPTGKPQGRINIYGFVSFDFGFIPPNLPRCISCEAGFQQWVSNNLPDFTKTSGPQTISLNAVNNRMRVFVGVAGAKGFVSGDYELKIEMK